MQRLILATILIAGALSLSDAEPCLLRAIAGSDVEYAFDQHEALIRDLLRDYELLPAALKEAIKGCFNSAVPFSDSCERKFGLQGCEPHGFLNVKRCEKGFRRIDAGLCTEVCPPETAADAAGALCAKPKVAHRTSYASHAQCVTRHPECEQEDGRWIGVCPPNYKPLGATMCAYACPAGFIDTPEHCVPRLEHTPEYFVPQMRVRTEGGLIGMQD